jgi:molecular chaperone DnaK
MARATIDFGIDLGTTNSEIAHLNGTSAQVIKNLEGIEYTPSAVWLDRGNNLVVGRTAREYSFRDPDNAFTEFKLQMGSDAVFTFARNKRRVKPEELSAEVLKSLRENVRNRLGEELEAAVITVPAAFELPQSDATRRAAELAGIRQAPLLQEPVAAALAHGFQSEDQRAMWLVFDFGGGTFDAAVISVRDGIIQVVNHGGDNHLGGKLIDWAIVERLVIPALQRQYKLSSLARGSQRWRSLIAKLKICVEDAKLRLSAALKTDLHLENEKDEAGNPIEFDFELNRADVERVAMPYFTKAVEIARRVLSEKKLGPADVSKVILLGGPTQMPICRQTLSSSDTGLGIPLDFRVDPLTAVAQGAAIFAGTQRLGSTTHRALREDQNAIELEYKPVGVDAEPLVAGRVVPNEGESLSGFTLEFLNVTAQPRWRSGRIALGPDGKFLTSLWAVKGTPNQFSIEVLDARGANRNVVPDSLTYTIGLTISEAPITHNLGVALANNQAEWFFLKGTPLPARITKPVRTVAEVRKGDPRSVARIPIVEGDKPYRADLNTLVGAVLIDGTMVKRDLPLNTEIELTLKMDTSGLPTGTAFVPLLDEEFPVEFDLTQHLVLAKELEAIWQRDKAQFERAVQEATAVGSQTARRVADHIEAVRTMQEIEATLKAAAADKDAANKCERLIREVRAAYYEVTDKLQWPKLVQQAEAQVTWAEKVVNAEGDPREKEALVALVQEVRAAIEDEATDALKYRVGQLSDLTHTVLYRQAWWWVEGLDYMEQHCGLMTDQPKASQLLQQGKRAMNADDFEGLRAAVRQLANLLPEEKREEVPGYRSTVI